MKKLAGLIAVAVFILNGCSQELEVNTADIMVAEYGDGLVKKKLYDAAEVDKNLMVKKIDGYDAKKLGEQTIIVIFTDGKKETEKKIKVKVEDTRKPEIDLKKDKVTIIAGEKLEFNDNVESVKDPIDGYLKYSDKKVEKDGYYFDKGKLDTKKDGTYEVKIIAADKNGNKSEKEFKVVVEKKKETNSNKYDNTYNGNGGNTPIKNNNTVSQQPSFPSASNGNNGNTGDNSNNRNSGNGGTSTPPVEKPQEPVTCTLPKSGDDGKVYASKQEAWDAGWLAVETEGSPFFGKGFGTVGAYDSCDNVYYVLVFYDPIQ